MLVEPQYSAQQGRDVTTYLVSPRGGGALHCSIQQAIDKAEPYSRISIQGGTYFESINITQPLELVGEEGVLPELVCRGIGITVAVDIECYVENIKVTTKGVPTVSNHQTLLRGTNASVRIISGMPTFVQCELASVYVGGNASPTLCNCSIAGSVFGAGITVAEFASGKYKNNVVSNHVPYCVVVSSKGEPVFEDNEFSQNGRRSRTTSTKPAPSRRMVTRVSSSSRGRAVTLRATSNRSS
jgi:nitrous oxidase accessory protein NosD